MSYIIPVLNTAHYLCCFFCEVLLGYCLLPQRWLAQSLHAKTLSFNFVHTNVGVGEVFVKWHFLENSKYSWTPLAGKVSQTIEK